MKMTAIAAIDNLPADGIKQMLKLLLNLTETGDRLRDLRTNELAVTLPQPMHFYGDGIHSQSQLSTHWIVSAIARRGRRGREKDF